LTTLYRIHEFAELAGVTVKALHHYDRLGLLKPERTDGGYRMYAERDLERLEQIIALKFIGIPLKQIKVVLDQPALELPDILRFQRMALEEKQQLLSRAIRAIHVAEAAVATGRPARATILRRIIEVCNMHNEVEVMRKYYSTTEAWEKCRRFYEEGPSREWQELYRDVAGALEEDPSSQKAQTLADRWLKLALSESEFLTNSMTAWMDREHWPPSIKHRIEEFNLERIYKYVSRAVLDSRKKYFTERAWGKIEESRKDTSQFSVVWQSRVDLFREIELSLDGVPAAEQLKAIAERWMVHLDTASGGDPGVKAGLMNTWADRRNWTATVRWLEEGLSMVTGDRFDQAAEFIDRAMASCQPDPRSPNTPRSAE
jgi:DNA-binding transcriptional MerR regulator